MIGQEFQSDDLSVLLAALCDGTINAEDFARLERRLETDPAARRWYISYLDLHGELYWDHLRLDGREPGGKADEREMGVDELFPSTTSAATDYSSFVLPPSESPDHESPLPSIVIDPSSTLNSPFSPFLSSPGGWLLSYGVATVIMGVALLGAWVYKISHYQELAGSSSHSMPVEVRPELVFVGRITGMKECRWSDPQTEAYGGAFVPLGRKYALSSGLMEITYKSGAKVIIEGPCTYEVDSRTGGYLSLGKLTARIEKEKSEVRGRKSEHSPLFPLPSPLFFVRTPMAIITDLGTEFGVEVSPGGNTVSFVFRGSVKVEVVGDDQNQEVVLREKESVYVEKGDNGTRLVLDRKVTDSPKFVRRMVEPPKLLDLLDIVAGGRGTGNRRERGINPSTGKSDPLFLSIQHRFEHRYHSVAWHKLIDGVFIPDGLEKPVKLDSAGHTFGDFGPLSEGLTIGSIWARAADISPYDRDNSRWRWVYSMGRGEQFMPKGRGLLALHSNSGITFDLKAMREMHQGVWPARFRATTGIADAKSTYPEPFGKADVWVFADGRLKWTRKLQHQDGPVGINVELGPKDRFLTLMSTNAGNGSSCDWVVLGDPVLEMKSTEATEQREDRPMEQ